MCARFGKKGDADVDWMVWAAIGLAVLVIGIGIIMYLKSQGIGLGDFIKNMLTFGG